MVNRILSQLKIKGILKESPNEELIIDAQPPIIDCEAWVKDGGDTDYLIFDCSVLNGRYIKDYIDDGTSDEYYHHPQTTFPDYLEFKLDAEGTAMTGSQGGAPVDFFLFGFGDEYNGTPTNDYDTAKLKNGIEFTMWSAISMGAKVEIREVQNGEIINRYTVGNCGELTTFYFKIQKNGTTHDIYADDTFIASLQFPPTPKVFLYAHLDKLSYIKLYNILKG